jgi:hypothetical protein
MLKALFCATVAAAYVAADEIIYVDNVLSSTWRDRSWGSMVVYNATDIKIGSSSISINSSGHSALSLYDTSAFSTFAGLKFDVAVCTSIKLMLPFNHLL